MKKILYILLCIIISVQMNGMQQNQKPGKIREKSYDAMIAMLDAKCYVDAEARRELHSISQKFAHHKSRIAEFVGQIICAASLDRSNSDKEKLLKVPVATAAHIRECWIYEQLRRNDGQDERFAYFQLVFSKRSQLDEVALLKLRDIVQRSMETEFDDLTWFADLVRSNYSIKKEKARFMDNDQAVITAQDLENAFNKIEYSMEVTEL